MRLSIIATARFIFVSSGIHAALAFAPQTSVSARFSSSSSLSMAVSKEDLLGAQASIDKILDEKNCGPIFVRLAWHDSGMLLLFSHLSLVSSGVS